MKNDPWIGVLVGVLGILAVAFLGLTYFYITYSRETRQLQPQVINANIGQQIANSMLHDVTEYGKQHPDILEYIGGPKPANVAPPTAVKPPGK